MVTRQYHVRNFESDIVGPLLPEIPVGFVQNAHVATQRTTLIGDLAGGERNLVLRGDNTARELGAGAIVADGPIICAGEDPRERVIGVTDVTTMPCESESLVDSFEELRVCPAGISVSHIVQHRDGELG